MAAIDKIYITGWDNYCKFREWVEAQPSLSDKYGKKVRLIDYFSKFTEDEWQDKEAGLDTTRPVMNNPYYIDAYIIRNCPLDFVQKELMVNYGHWSQERIQNFYDDIKNWNVKENGPCPYWAKLDDFFRKEDGTLILNGLEKSSYQMILDNELYVEPYRKGVEYGKHCTMIKSPRNYGYNNFERPLKGNWFVDIKLPDGDYMWYHRGKKFFGVGTWDFCDEFVDSNYASSCAFAKTIASLKRKIRKWKLPIGTKVIATGRYVNEHYEFIVRK